ncbi:hypothetical protein GCM10023235_49210 [Kitasatospora terrestris]|uniref:Uncharacterized protein n=1 Tax=Kitasatospora terrestris TaxID=258051 RepID=A0ABP9E0N1_9ACTN
MIPADPYWRPERGVGERVAALVAGREPDADHEVSWYDRVTAVDCGGNLERIARFEIEVWNPEREWFTETELAHLGAALGHPVRQIRAHV